MIVTDLCKPKSKYLYEGLDHQSLQTVMLWESVGQQIYEAQLTADQINLIFQYVEQGATAAGGNRTMIGKGKDAASAVNRAWEDLKTKVSTSGPIQGVDKLYDQAAAKLKQATGGDQGVMQYVQKYRDFAKKHPVAQSLIYSALIAAAGISGAGIGGAAALGLFKLVDKLLQGEKFSSAAYQGAKTGAMAYGASKLGDLIKGKPDASTGAGSAAQGPNVDDKIAAARARVDAANAKLGIDGSSPNYDVTGTAGQAVAQNTLAATRQAVEKEAMAAIKSRIANGDIAPGNTGAIRDLAYKMLDGSGMPQQAIETSVEKLVTQAMGNAVRESKNLSESQIYLLIGMIVDRQRKLDEGIMDTIKGAAGKAVNWAQTKGKNLTTKITADKLMQAWKKAGSPMDSLDVASIIQNAGVPSPIIKQVYGTMNIPFAGEPGAGPATQRNISVAGPQNTVTAQTGTAADTAAPAKTPTSTKSAAADPAAPAQTATSSAAGTTALDPADKTAKVGGAQAQVPYYGINPVTKKPWTVDELQAKASSTSTAAPVTQTTPSASTAAASSAVPTTATSDATSTPASTSSSSLTPSQIRQQRQQAAAAVAQQQMKTSTTTTPSTTAATQPTPAEIRQQRQQAAAAVAQQQMAGSSQAAPSAPVGFDAGNVMKLPGMPSTAKTAGAPTKFPSYGTAGQQGNYKPASVTASTTTALPKPTTTKITPSAPGAPTAPAAPAAPNVPGTYNPRTGAAQMGGKSMVAFKDLPAAVQKKIDPTLAEQVKHMLESVQTKKDVERIREYIDNYYNQTALTETVKTQRRKLMDHVTKVSAIRRRIYAQSIRN